MPFECYPYLNQQLKHCEKNVMAVLQQLTLFLMIFSSVVNDLSAVSTVQKMQLPEWEKSAISTLYFYSGFPTDKY